MSTDLTDPIFTNEDAVSKPESPPSQQLREFYAVLGHAISAWQMVETRLCIVYEAAVSPHLPEPLLASFHSVQSFNAKLQLTDAAVSC